MSIESALLIVGAYLLGSVPAAYLAAKHSRGIDIRQYGPGHVGVGNLWRITSKKVALPIIIFDYHCITQQIFDNKRKHLQNPEPGSAINDLFRVYLFVS